MLSLLKQTAREKRANIAALNLFFGALLGANLGTMTDLPPRDYVSLIMYLVAAVVVVQLVSSTTRRLYAYGSVAAITIFLALTWFEPSLRPDSLGARQYGNILLTLAVWLSLVMAVELTPVINPKRHLT